MLRRLLDALGQQGYGPTRATATSWRSLCPAHADTRPSLSISRGDEREVVLNCFAGCEADAVLDALGLTWATLAHPDDEEVMQPEGSLASAHDTTPPAQPGHTNGTGGVITFTTRNGNGHGHQRLDARRAALLVPELPEVGSTREDGFQLICYYDYADDIGKLQYKIARYERWTEGAKEKDFRPFTPLSTGGWVMRRPQRRWPYRLPELLAGIAAGREVYVCEGEADCDSIYSAGGIATCNDGGAGKWEGNMHTRWLEGATLVSIIEDRDVPGREHALKVFWSCAKNGIYARVVQALDGKDARDHINAGHGLREFVPTGIQIGNFVEEIPVGALCWLWHRRLPLGSCVVVAGDSGLGKSTMTLDLARRVTRGEPWPDGQRGGPPGGVVIVNSEDPVAEVVRPRLEVAGADLSKIIVVERSVNEDGTPKPFTVPDDMAILEAAIRRARARFVVIDPLAAYLDSKTDSFKDQSIRRVLLYLQDLAVQENCCILVVQHISKSPTAHKAKHLGIGSVGIVNAARAAFAVMESPDDPTGKEMLFAMTKSNWEERPDTLVYRLDRSVENPAVAQVTWLGTSERTADEVLSMMATPAEAAGGATDADEFLHELLRDEGPQPVTEILKRAAKEGITRAALNRSRERLEVLAVRQPGVGAVWELPITFGAIQ